MDVAVYVHVVPELSHFTKTLFCYHNTTYNKGETFSFLGVEKSCYDNNQCRAAQLNQNMF